ncbi:ImmA/IrrE family metallo-endopeptidase [Treponema sp. TIM-1]
MRNNALITSKILTWARERLDLSLEEAAEYLKKKPEVLKSWEEGNKYPTINQAKAIAKKLKIPYVYFFLPDPPQNIKLPKNQDYRTLSNQPLKKYSVELKTLLFDIMQRREVMLDLYRQMEREPQIFNHFFDIKSTDNKSIAKAIRELLQLPERFKQKDRDLFNFFRNILENMGVLVFQAAGVSPVEMRGLSVLEEIFPIIVVNRKDPISARIFTLAHEFTHLVTRTAGICDNAGMSELSSFDIELKCNHIAAQILVPEELLKTNNDYKQLVAEWDDVLVRQIANAFSVSREVIIGRLLTFKNISLDFYRRKMRQYAEEYNQTKQNKKDGLLLPDIDKETQLGKAYISTVLTAYNQEIITARDAIQYFDGLRLEHFEKLERWCSA